MKNILLVIALVISTHVNADEATRQQKIAEIIEVQELQKMFQSQLDQSKSQATELGKSIYRKILSENGVSDAKGNPKVEQVFSQYIERCSSMFSAKEFIDIWSRFYGKDLSEADVDKILAYYKSPVGKKDIAASHAAMAGFTQVLIAESQKRLSESIGQLMIDLKAALEASRPLVEK